MMDESELRCFRRYFPSGALMCEYYENSDGQRIGWSRHWYENNQLMSEIYYKNGLSEGVSKTYSENGKLIIYQELINGKLNGFYKSWFNDGTIKEDGYYVNDVAQLGYKWYKPNGELWCILDEAYLEKMKEQ
ncbi:MAG: hypothetical protein RR575_02910 [Acinetobacter sp.]